MNQNTVKVALLHSKSNQVKVATKKKLLKKFSLVEKTTRVAYSSKSISSLYTTAYCVKRSVSNVLQAA